MSPVGLFVLISVLQAVPGGVRGVVRGVGLEPWQAVVYLVPERPDPATMASLPGLIDQREISFLPRVLVVEAGATVRFRNSDPILHNVFSPAGSGPGFDLGTYPRSDQRERRFGEPGVQVILCHVHPEMIAFVVVVPTPHHALVSPDGRFGLEGVPAGRYRLRVWLYGAEPIEREIQVMAGRTLDVELELTPARSGR